MNLSYSELRENYEKAGQGHVFQFFHELTLEAQNEFLDQLSRIDAQVITKTGKQAMDHHYLLETADCDVEPLPSGVMEDINNNSSTDMWYKMGMDLIKNNQVAVILMAGGQGTRLGSADPKGCYDIGLPSKKSLFQLQAERIYCLQKLAAAQEQREVVIPWYIMTSGPTDKPTRDFFIKHNYFGLKPENVMFFQQGVMPCFTNEGKFMLQEKGKVSHWCHINYTKKNWLITN
jgi:UDP-N-acetylglucosamine/UDP-N-acetylgalactosamine diphosphorylase